VRISAPKAISGLLASKFQHDTNICSIATPPRDDSPSRVPARSRMRKVMPRPEFERVGEVPRSFDAPCPALGCKLPSGTPTTPGPTGNRRYPYFSSRWDIWPRDGYFSCEIRRYSCRVEISRSITLGCLVISLTSNTKFGKIQGEKLMRCVSVMTNSCVTRLILG
jgi:hypothetical protein